MHFPCGFAPADDTVEVARVAERIGFDRLVQVHSSSGGVDSAGCESDRVEPSQGRESS
jgi:hypothetical protein